MANNATTVSNGYLSNNPDFKVADDLIGDKRYQQVKLVDSTEGATAPIGTAANPLPVSDFADIRKGVLVHGVIQSGLVLDNVPQTTTQLTFTSSPTLFPEIGPDSLLLIQIPITPGLGTRRPFRVASRVGQVVTLADPLPVVPNPILGDNYRFVARRLVISTTGDGLPVDLSTAALTTLSAIAKTIDITDLRNSLERIQQIEGFFGQWGNVLLGSDYSGNWFAPRIDADGALRIRQNETFTVNQLPVSWGTPLRTSVTTAASIVALNFTRRAFIVHVESGSVRIRWGANPSSTVYSMVLSAGTSYQWSADGCTTQSFHAESVSGTSVILTTEGT